MKVYPYAEWVRRWESRQLGFDEMTARRVGYLEGLREELKANDRMRREYPLASWPVGQRACDNEGEVDG